MKKFSCYTSTGPACIVVFRFYVCFPRMAMVTVFATAYVSEQDSAEEIEPVTAVQLVSQYI